MAENLPEENNSEECKEITMNLIAYQGNHNCCERRNKNKIAKKKTIKVTRNPETINEIECAINAGYNFLEPSELLKFVSRDTTDLKYYCTICSKYSHKGITSTRNHVESNHFPKMFTYHCDQCDSTFATKSNYNMHKSMKHNLKKIQDISNAPRENVKNHKSKSQ